MEGYLVAGFTLARVVAVILLCSCGVPATSAQSQTGFLNIDCGATEQYVDPGTGLKWLPDTPFITTGKIQPSLPLPASLQSFTEMKSLRYFDNFRPTDRQTKYCYALPVTADTIYMLRTTFYYGNFDNAGKPPSFQVAIDATIVDNVTTLADDGSYSEFQYVSQGTVTFLCLIRTSQLMPFISGITLKPVGPMVAGFDKQFGEFIQQGTIMSTLARVNFGGAQMLRFPTDVYDRFWFSESGTDQYYLTPTTSPVEFLSTNTTIPLFEGADFYPPSAVLQTAVTSSGVITSYLLPPGLGDGYSVYVTVYYGELVSSGTLIPRRFSIQVKGILAIINMTGTFLDDFGSWQFWPGGRNVGRTSTVVMAPLNSSLGGPILNAMEVFSRAAQRVSKTNDRDALAIEAIKLELNLTEWTGDPCLPIPHSWVTCSSDSATLLPEIAAVDLSGYGLEGILPPSFSNLSALTSLRLENNKFSGPLPDWLTYLTKLRTLSIQNNNFSGAIPAALLSPNLMFTCYPGNPFLQGGPPRPPPIYGSSTHKSNVAVIVGASIGGGVGLVVISLIAFFAFRRCQRKRKPRSLDYPEPSTKRIEIAGGAKAFTLAEIIAATNNFTTELGKGGFGLVYYGKLPDGQEVAVKVSNGSSRQGEKEFFNEVDILSRVHHKSLVRLVGYCLGRRQILLYEYIHNGSLFDHLHGKSASTVGTLDWKTRLQIAVNAAQGLEYLHTGCSPSFIHRDVKSSNILLTLRCDAKVADFGLTRLMAEGDESKVLTMVMGTPGYLDPEYYTTQQVSSKSDVYSFGVVLLELLTGRLPIELSPGMENRSNISEWVRERLQSSNIDSILDPAVRASNPNLEAVWHVAEVAMRCVEPKGMHRPPMSEVLQELLVAIAMEGAFLPPP